MASTRLHRHRHTPPPSLPPSTSQNPNPTITPPPQDRPHISNSSSHLTRHQVLMRRAHYLRQLARVYTDHYWAIAEELREKYKEYVWKYGLSPYKEGDHDNVDDGDGGNKGLEGNNNMNTALCAFNGCMLKAMALTRFCHLHILSDSKQVLYKPCEYVIKSAQAGPITCGRPILRARVPAFCNVHLQKAHRVLKKAGLHISSSSKLAPKFHVIVAEYVRQIQAKRRAALRANRNKTVVKRESCNWEAPCSSLKT